MKKKTLFFRSLTELKDGTEVDLGNFQTIIMKNNDKGDSVPHILDMSLVEEKDESVMALDPRPGMWMLSSKNALVKLEVKDVKYFETETYDEISNHFRKFRDKIDTVYKRRGLLAKRSFLLGSAPGCHAKGQLIIMYDGSFKKIEDIVVGDKVMGPDSLPRTVLDLVKGKEKMVKIIPQKGEPFVVNWNHIQSFVVSGTNMADMIINTPIKYVLSENFSGPRTGQKASGSRRLKLYKPEKIIFNNTNKLLVPPYIMGVWLGDGTTKKPQITSMDKEISDEWCKYGESLGLTITINEKKVTVNGIAEVSKARSYSIVGKKGRNHTNKFILKMKKYGFFNTKDYRSKYIPSEYLTSSVEERLELLAGIIDTDGYVNQTSGDIQIATKYKELAENIAFLARSLGKAAYVNAREKYAANTIKKTKRTYYMVQISGDCCDIPTRLERKKSKKRNQIKNVLRNGFKTEILPEDDYYGITVSGDHLYLLNDFTVTHNCGKSSLINKFMTEIKDEAGMCIIRIDSSNIDYDEVLTALTLSKQDKVSFLVLIIEDIGGTTLHERSNRVDGALLNMLDGNQDVFKVPIMIIATTNYLDLLDKTLTNRPGRFDYVYEVPPPKDSELIWLMEQFLEREMTKEEKIAVSGKKINPAYGKEIVIRSEVYDITLEEAAKQILEQREKATSSSYHKEKTTMGFGDDID